MANVRAVAIRNFLKSQDCEISEVIELNSMMATLDLIARSDWQAILPTLMMTTRTYRDAFDVWPTEPLFPLQLVQVEQAKRGLPPIADAFCRLLHDHCLRLA